MKIKVRLTIEVDKQAYAERKGIPVSETAESLAHEFALLGDSFAWNVAETKRVQTALANFPTPSGRS
jgi:hypothetical protein